MKGNLLPVSSDEQAYWLGFIAADGHVSKNGRYLSIQIAQKDQELLEKFVSFSEAKFYTGKVFDVRTEKEYFWCKAVVFSTELNAALRGIGLGPNKTFGLTGEILDNIPDDLKGAFFRGYFDGDGHIGNIKGNEFRLTVVGTEAFLYALNLNVQRLAKVGAGSIYPSGSIYHLSYTGVERIRHIREWMRSDGPWLERKKQVWESVQQRGTSQHPYIYLMKTGKWWARWRNPSTGKYVSFGKFSTESEAYEAQQVGIAEFSRGL